MGEEKEMLITVCVTVWICAWYINTYVQQKNLAEDITKYRLPLKAKTILSLGELLKRYLFEELDIEVHNLSENISLTEVGVACNMMAIFI